MEAFENNPMLNEESRNKVRNSKIGLKALYKNGSKKLAKPGSEKWKKLINQGWEKK